MSSTALLVERNLDPALRPRLQRAAELARMAVRTWAPGASDAPAPDVIMGALDQGHRRLSDDLLRLADETYPGAPVLLVSAEPLVQPVVLLQGGRLTLLGPPHAAEVIAEHLSAALAWRALDRHGHALASVTPVTSKAIVQRHDHQRDRAWAAVIAPLARSAPYVELHAEQGLTAVLAPAAIPSLARELLPTLDAWQDQPDSDQLRRSLSGRTGALAAMVHLEAGAQRWLLVGSGHRWPLVLISNQRLPAWWSFAGTGDDPVQVCDAEAGDVVLACAPLPDDPAFAPSRLAQAAGGGGRALADHLGEQAQRLGLPITAAVLEILP
jgi:hypothetical protein